MTTYLTNSQVNSGNTINLHAKDVQTSIEVFSSVEDTPNSPSDDYDDRLPEGKNTGFGSPQHVVQGVYDLNDAHTTGAGAGIDFEYILDLIENSDQICTLTDDVFITSTNVSGDKNVMLIDFSQTKKTTNVISYSMTFKEVRS